MDYIKETQKILEETGSILSSALQSKMMEKMGISRPYAAAILSKGVDEHWTREKETAQKHWYSPLEKEETVLEPLQLKAIDRIVAQLEGMGVKYRIDTGTEVFKSAADFTQWKEEVRLLAEACPIGQVFSIDIPKDMDEPLVESKHCLDEIFKSEEDYDIEQVHNKLKIYKGAVIKT